MRRLLAATLLALITACGGDSSQRPLVVPGTYLMKTINGAVLPFIIQAAAPKVELISDELVLATGGTFTEAALLRVTDGTTVTNERSTDTGTWTVNGTALTLKAPDGTQITGTLTTDGALALSANGLTAVYQKQ